MFAFALAESSIQLVPDGTLLFHLLLILVMVWVLNKTLFKPINRVLEEREKQTEGSLGETQALIASTNEKMREYEAELREARTEGYRELEQQKVVSVREREQILDSLKNEVSGWVAQQKAEIAREAESAQSQLQAESGTMGKEIASRILGRPIQ